MSLKNRERKSLNQGRLTDNYKTRNEWYYENS